MSSEYRTASEDGPGLNKGYLELSSEEPSADSSATPSRPSSSGGNAPQKKSRVRFNSTSEANDTTNQKSKFPLRDRDNTSPPLHVTVPKQTKISPANSRTGSISHVLRRTTPETEKENPFTDPTMNPAFKPRPSLLRNNSSGLMNETNDVDDFNEKTFSALAAQERAQRIASVVGSNSAPASRRTSLDEIDEEYSTSPHMRSNGLPVRIDDIPLMDMDSRRTYDGTALDSDDDDLEMQKETTNSLHKKGEAHKLVRAHSRRYPSDSMILPAEPASGFASGQNTPPERLRDDGYVQRPAQYRGGILSSLLKLYNQPQGAQSRRGSDASTASPSRTGTQTASLVSSGRSTPKTKGPKWYNHKTHSQDTLAGLIEASAILGAQGGVRTPKKPTRPGPGKRTQSGRLIDAAMSRMSKPRLEDEIRITIHIAETLSRQKYLLKLCRALMTYGAPTHRLEEYMKMSARVLEIDGQFLYIPGCMIISFDDVTTHTTEVKIVRANQGVDLGKLKDIHKIYKEVTHDMIGVEEATQRLDAIIKMKQKHNPWLLVFMYGMASATVGPFGNYFTSDSSIKLTLFSFRSSAYRHTNRFPPWIPPWLPSTNPRS